MTEANTTQPRELGWRDFEAVGSLAAFCAVSLDPAFTRFVAEAKVDVEASRMGDASCGNLNVEYDNASDVVALSAGFRF